ncbi:hypothetical protein RRG08_011528 [Elysia crispata]|uniref:Uncharacterized protein n=1 Tax=Elysia crispata TaxID=231223 RepID=A0AAE1AQ17_9GAST|nr:hypothetical protein RRG08_011528 [Elysia crispata]
MHKKSSTQGICISRDHFRFIRRNFVLRDLYIYNDGNVKRYNNSGANVHARSNYNVANGKNHKASCMDIRRMPSELVGVATELIHIQQIYGHTNTPTLKTDKRKFSASWSFLSGSPPVAEDCCKTAVS